MASQAQHRARARYWAIVHYGRRHGRGDGGEHGRKPCGYVLDFYPEEEARHRRSLEREGATILGAFATDAEAKAAVWQEMQRLADERNRKRRVSRVLRPGDAKPPAQRICH